MDRVEKHGYCRSFLRWIITILVTITDMVVLIHYIPEYAVRAPIGFCVLCTVGAFIITTLICDIFEYFVDTYLKKKHYIDRKDLEKYWDSKSICIEFSDGTDALAQENGYTLQQCLAMDYMDDVKFFLD